MNTRFQRDMPGGEGKLQAMSHVLAPKRAIWRLGREGITAIPPEMITSGNVGVKAFGLASIPKGWTPEYIVVDEEALALKEEDLGGYITETLANATIPVGSVIVRSSGIQESIRNRGKLASEVCHSNQIVATIRKHTSIKSGLSIKGVHWIVQKYVHPKVLGHLSNERHLRREHRDWIMETELQHNRPSYFASVAVRAWRHGNKPIDLDLICGSEAQITLTLRKVAHWATAFGLRFHLEWVWDGNRIWIVQIDTANEEEGTAPPSLRAGHVEEVSAEKIKLFSCAGNLHYTKLKKIRNVKIYSDLGYQMPEFYILENKEIIRKILEGEIPAELERDLSYLTKRPLILRTDGYDIPEEKREMLPRSDEIRSLDAAKTWLTTKFKIRIEESALQSSSLCLIGHHFLPSVASAWAGAEPGKRMVRIESLWGLPEGLYWYSHDTFEVDAQKVGHEPLSAKNSRIFKHLRYKGTFIAPDKSGHWLPMRTSVPYDWLPSIRRDQWIYEVAETTRRIADNEGQPTTVMWLIDNDKRVTKHELLPWYHEKWQLDDRPKAAPRKKMARSQEYIITDSQSWDGLKKLVREGAHIERITVKPFDPDLIRNPSFAEELGGFVSSHNIVVELAGGILSHAYYVLKRAGAQVECIDLVGAEDDVIEYNKLVRDKIPALIEGRDEKVEVIQISGDALVTALRQKLVEEAFEVVDAKDGEQIITELADIQEVVNAIAQAIQSTPSQVISERKEKRKLRGGFDNGYVLQKTATPHTLSSPGAIPESSHSFPFASVERKSKVIDSGALPTSPPYRRPDMRSVDQQPEKLILFDVELNRVGNPTKLNTTFEFPIDSDITRRFNLSIEFIRNGATLKMFLRLKQQPRQMNLNIPET